MRVSELSCPGQTRTRVVSELMIVEGFAFIIISVSSYESWSNFLLGSNDNNSLSWT